MECKGEINTKPLFIVRAIDQINFRKLNFGFNTYHRKCYEDKILPKIEPYANDVKETGFRTNPKPDYQMINSAIVCLPIGIVLLIGGILTLFGPLNIVVIIGIIATLLGLGLIAYSIAIAVGAIKSL